MMKTCESFGLMSATVVTFHSLKDEVTNCTCQTGFFIYMYRIESVLFFQKLTNDRLPLEIKRTVLPDTDPKSIGSYRFLT